MTLGAAAKEVEHRHLSMHAWTRAQVFERAATLLARHIGLQLHHTLAWLVIPRYLKAAAMGRIGGEDEEDGWGRINEDSEEGE